MTRAAVMCEQAGIPTVSVVAKGFVSMFKAMAEALGFANLPVAVYPGVVPTDSVETLREKVASAVLPDVVQGLTAAADTTATADEPGAEDIVFSGTLDEVHEHFQAHHWSDGLPIIPPTPERVAAFLACTPRAPDEVLGVLPAEGRQATVRSVAVNGVMAGCRPEYMPILVAAVEAMADPLFRLEDAGSTPAWEPQVVVTGPAVHTLGFNTRAGALKAGVQANSSVGRFVRLFMRNVCGFRFAPAGDTDRGTIGFNFNVALAEDDETVRALGWPSFRAELGLAEADTTVTVQSLVGTTGPLYSSGSTPEEHLEALVQIASAACGGWAGIGVRLDAWHPLLMLNPSVAAVFVNHGWSKDDIRAYLYEHAQVPARWMDRTFQDIGMNEVSLERLVAAGEAPPVYAASDDPNRLVPVFLRPAWIRIVVAGDPSRNQSRFLVNNHNQGVPVTRVAEVVDDGRDNATPKEKGAT